MWARNRFKTIFTPLALAAVMAALSAGLNRSAAAPDAPPEPVPAAANEQARRQSLFKAIHSTIYRERDAATAALLRLPSAARSDVENVLAAETDPEAIERLKIVAVHLLLKDPQETPMEGKAGLMGIVLRSEVINFGDAQNADDYRMAIVVVEVKPGFPAYELLKNGDRIIGVEGRPLTLDSSIETFRTRVSSKRPGSFINLTVLRGGAQSRVDVQLAGVGMPGDDPRRVLVEKRELKTRNYLDNLKTGLTTPAMVIPDSTPTAFNIYNDVEFDDGNE